MTRYVIRLKIKGRKPRQVAICYSPDTAVNATKLINMSPGDEVTIYEIDENERESFWYSKSLPVVLEA